MTVALYENSSLFEMYNDQIWIFPSKIAIEGNEGETHVELRGFGFHVRDFGKDKFREAALFLSRSQLEELRDGINLELDVFDELDARSDGEEENAD